MGAKLHPYLERRREYTLCFYKRSPPVSVEGGPYDLMGTRFMYLGGAIDALTVGLDEIANRFLVCGHASIERVLRDGPKPHSTTMIDYWDDKELDYHWAEVYKTHYEIRLLMDGRAVRSDLLAGMDRIERLLANTDGLSNRVRTNKDPILCDYLWMALLAGEMDRAYERAERIAGVDTSRTSAIRGFRRRASYLRMLFLVVRCARGEEAFRTGAKKSLSGLLELHWDLENEIQNLKLPGSSYGFEWSWLWECVFEEAPSVSRAIDRLRVMVPDEGSSA